MISKERREELEVIADEIISALSCERYEPSERGAGWAVTDEGYDAVIDILVRSKARLWKESSAERRAEAMARAAWKAKKVAKILLGNGNKTGQCIHCFQFVYKKEEMSFWHSPSGDTICEARRRIGHTFWEHEVQGDR